MIAVLAELEPREGHTGRYVELAQVLGDYGLRDRTQAPAANHRVPD